MEARPEKLECKYGIVALGESVLHIIDVAVYDNWHIIHYALSAIRQHREKKECEVAKLTKNNFLATKKVLSLFQHSSHNSCELLQCTEPTLTCSTMRFP